MATLSSVILIHLLFTVLISSSNVPLVILEHEIVRPFAPVLPINVSLLCRTESQYYLDELDNLTPWALNMYDASSKFPSGLITGNIHQLGNYDQCVNVEGSSPDGSLLVKGQHCMATIQFTIEDINTTADDSEWNTTRFTTLDHKSTQSGSTMLRGNRFSKESFDLKDLLIAMADAAGLHNWTGPQSDPYAWSYCVPASCSPQDVATALRERLSSLANPGRVAVSVTVAENQCSTLGDNNIRWTGADIAVVVLMGVFGIILLSSTTYDIITNIKLSSKTRDKKCALLSSFSVYSNCKILFNTERPPDSLACINGIRVLSMCWVISRHIGNVSERSPIVNSSETHHLTEDWAYMMLEQANLSTETFFLIGATLLCYGFKKERSRRIKFNLGIFYLQRYIRLTPPYAMVLFFYATLLTYVGSGPLWGPVVGSLKTACVENWWTNLLYANNFIAADTPCMGQTWYLAVDMQLFLVSPLIVYPLARWPKIGKCLLGAALASSTLATFFLSYPNVGGEKLFTTAGKMPEYILIYIKPYTRGCSYSIGIALGYLLYNLKGNPIQLNKFHVTCGWLASVTCCLAAVFGNYAMLQPTYQYDAVAASAFEALYRPVYGLGVAWVIFACIQGVGGPVNAILSGRFFMPLSRLSYSAYLCHMMVIYYKACTRRTPGYFSAFNLVTDILGTIIITFILAGIVFLAFELPFLNLNAALLRRGQPRLNGKNNVEIEAIEMAPKSTTSIEDKESVKDIPYYSEAVH